MMENFIYDHIVDELEKLMPTLYESTNSPEFGLNHRHEAEVMVNAYIKGLIDEQTN
jgi:hypothetical protein